jgi:hypothetical protein
MDVWKLTLREFLAGDVTGPTNESVEGILSAMPDPKWTPGAEMRLIDYPNYATAPATGGRGNADLLLLEETRDGWIPVGCYVFEALIITPRARRKGLSTELILRCSQHREVPNSRKLSQAGHAALSKAHRIAVERAVKAGLPVPETVRKAHGL